MRSYFASIKATLVAPFSNIISDEAPVVIGPFDCAAERDMWIGEHVNNAEDVVIVRWSVVIEEED
jgi:hypothetical protein